MLWTAIVKLHCYALINDRKLEVVDYRDLLVSAFESRASDSCTRRVVRFLTKSIWGSTTISINAFGSTHAFCPHPTVPHDSTIMMKGRKIKLADPREGERDLSIQFLIEGDYCSRKVKDASTIRLSPSLVLDPTKFGWNLTGNRTGIIVKLTTVNHKTLEHSDNDLRRFWDLETIGIPPNQERSMSTGDSQELQDIRD